MNDVIRMFEILDKETSDKGTWHIECNDHKNYYETSQQVIDNDLFEFENKEMRQKAIDTNAIYYLQWYKDTPVGFYSYSAPTLEELATYFVKDVEGE